MPDALGLSRRHCMRSRPRPSGLCVTAVLKSKWNFAASEMLLRLGNDLIIPLAELRNLAAHRNLLAH